MLEAFGVVFIAMVSCLCVRAMNLWGATTGPVLYCTYCTALCMHLSCVCDRWIGETAVRYNTVGWLEFVLSRRTLTFPHYLAHRFFNYSPTHLYSILNIHTGREHTAHTKIQQQEMTWNESHLHQQTLIQYEITTTADSCTSTVRK